MELTIYNKPDNWNNAYKTLLTCEEKNCTLIIEMNANYSTENNWDLLELAKVFPLADNLAQNEKNVTINIAKCQYNIHSRIFPLIFIQALKIEEKVNISLQYDGCPVHCIAGPYTTEKYIPFFSSKNPENRYTNKTVRLLKKAKVIQEFSSDSIEKRILLVDELLDTDMQNSIIKEINTVNNQYKYDISFQYKQETLSNIFPLISITNFDGTSTNDISMKMIALNKIPESFNDMNGQLSHLIYLEQCFEEYINNPDIFQGNKEKQINITQKELLIKELKKLYNDKKFSMSFFGRQIWISILRNMIESRELHSYSETVDGKKTWTLNVEEIERSALSCATYAEGLYQIIENSCLYSHGQTAYFGMRMYKISSTRSTCENLTRAETKFQLYNKYANCYKSSINGKISNDNLFCKDYSRLLEFYVLDDASSGEGILYKSRTTIKECIFKNLSGLIDYRPIYEANKVNSIDEYASKIAHHYGMRVFFKNIERNDGCIILETPHQPLDKSRHILYNSPKNKFDFFSYGKECYFTTYNILVPLLPLDENASSLSSLKTKTGNDLFLQEQESYSISRFKYNSLNSNDITSKEEKVDDIKNDLINKMNINTDNKLLAINAYTCTVYDAELLAKAIFKLVAEYCYTNKLKIAVLFSQCSNCPQEFIRIFSSFYDKLYEQEPQTKNFVKTILDNIQIAICTKHENEADSEISVNFVLLGNSPGSAYINARNYLYINFDTCVKYIPLLKYLALFTDYEQKVSEETPVFPFDLFLSKSCFETGEPIQSSPKKDCLFLDRMNTILHSDLQLHSDGCRIPNIHIRLGSKIHLNCFYEAELLFRSIGNVQRFAYIISGHILSSLSDKNNPIIIVGYEKYSAELILQISKLLGKAGVSAGAFLIPETGDKKNQCIELCPLLGDCFQNSDNETGHKTKHLLVSVIPVGSTMSTIYKVKHSFRNEYIKKSPNIEIVDFANYCIVAVNSQITEQKDDGDITWHYWKSVDTNVKQIDVLCDKNGDSEMTVNYLLSAEAKWLSPLITTNDVSCGCEMCKELSDFSILGSSRSPLLQVDKTSMVPNAIFKLKDSKNDFLLPKNKNENKNRIKLLKGHIEYGHVYQGNNHYQFFINHKELYQNNHDKIDNWLKKIKINQSAFNIVISPNDTDNIAFVSSALENIFGNCLRYLHIDINNAYKEDVRLKFSKIADEYKYLRLNMHDTKLNIYYVSNTIVSSQTIARAKLLISTLLDESGISCSYPYVFEKIILLICRSSFATMKQYVQFPDSQIEAFIQLNIPQYNTIADKCPACTLQEEYVLLRKRCTTDGLSQKFERLESKNRKRTLPEFGEWQKEDILTNHSYYCRLKNWLFFHKNPMGISKSEKKILFEAFDKEFQEILMQVTEKKNELNVVTMLQEDENIQERFKDIIYKRTLRDMVNKASRDSANKILTEHKIVEIVKKTVISDHNYMRLFCLQRAYEELIPLNADECTNVEEMNRTLDIITRKKILEIISQQLESKPNSRYAFAENAEWLISYIKVLSREHLSRYYYIKKAIVNIMYDMVEVIRASEKIVAIKDKLHKECSCWDPIIKTLRFFYDDGQTNRSIDNSLCASLQYELFMTLVHRLSVMQCSVVYQNSAITEALKGFSALNKKYFGLDKYALSNGSDDLLKYTELPPKREIISRYIKSIKTATMLTANDDSCYQLLEGE